LTPTNLVATAISNSNVSLTWDAVLGATNYQLLRSSNNGPFTLVGLPLTNIFIDPGLTLNTTYVYFVRAVDATNVGLPSNKDLATTMLFTDDPVVAGSTIVQAAHLTELRTAVNAVRKAAGLPPATCTDPSSAGILVKAVHITELRSSLDAARSILNLPTMSYTDPGLAAGDAIKAAHIQELRTGVR
ncbi:MAG: hypothetical protein ACXVH7_09915, partial [Thermoanaerobaculia bacterium]